MDIKRLRKDVEVFNLLLDINERPIEIEHIDEIGAKMKLFKNHIKMYEDIIESKEQVVKELEEKMEKLENYRAEVIHSRTIITGG